MQPLHVFLTDFASATGEDVIRMLHAADMLARHAGIRLGDTDILSLLDGFHRRLDAARDQFDVLDFAPDHTHPLYGGDLAVQNPDLSVLGFRADDRHHGIGPQVYRNNVISVFHFTLHVI